MGSLRNRASGPTGNGYGDAAGHTCVAIARIRDGELATVSRTLETGLSDREENMYLFAEEALGLLGEALD